MKRQSELRFRGSAVVTVIALFFLLGPLVSVVLFSFNRTSGLTMPLHGWSLRWYREIFAEPGLVSALGASAEVAAAVTVLATLLGTAGAYGLSHASGKIRVPLNGIFLLPLALPGLFIGIALLLFFEWVHIHLSLWTVGAGQLVFVLPFFILIARASMSRTDEAVEEAAADLGAGRFKIFFRVTLPVVWPVLAGAACLSFSLAFDEFGISFFLVGQQSTLPLYIWSRLQLTVDPSINAISTLLLGTTIVLFAGGFALTARGLKRGVPNETQ
jgi:spermidine/putrescine transport system permease protein